jgi:hypothetical protein
MDASGTVMIVRAATVSPERTPSTGLAKSVETKSETAKPSTDLSHNGGRSWRSGNVKRGTSSPLKRSSAHSSLISEILVSSKPVNLPA